jgi:hypothetical protein
LAKSLKKIDEMNMEAAEEAGAAIEGYACSGKRNLN